MPKTFVLSFLLLIKMPSSQMPQGIICEINKKGNMEGKSLLQQNFNDDNTETDIYFTFVKNKIIIEIIKIILQKFLNFKVIITAPKS